MPTFTPARAAEHPVYPLLGAAGAAVGVVLAVVLVPIDYGPAGNLVTSGMVLALGLLAAPAAAVYAHPFAIFRIENLVACGLVYWLVLDLVLGTYDLHDVPREAVEYGLVAIGLFAVAFWVGTFSRSVVHPPQFIRAMARQELPANTVFAAAALSFGLAFFRFAQPSGFDPLVMANGLIAHRSQVPWNRAFLGGWDAFIDHLAYFGYILPVLTVILQFRLGSWARTPVVVCVVMSLVISLFLMSSGNRRLIGASFGAALMCWALQHGRAATARHVAAVLGLIALLLVLMQAMLEYRSTGFKRLFQADDAGFQSTTLRVDDNFLRLCQLIDFIPRRYDFVEEGQLVWVAIRPVPRVLWPGKPVNPGFDLGEVNGLRGVSLTSSVIGELYMSYGWLGIAAGGVIYGILAGLCGQLLTLSGKPARLVLYGLAAISIFTGLRSMTELVLMSYMLLAWIAVSLVVNPVRLREPDRGPVRFAPVPRPRVPR